jgi:hypothetical protein
MGGTDDLLVTKWEDERNTPASVLPERAGLDTSRYETF